MSITGTIAAAVLLTATSFNTQSSTFTWKVNSLDEHGRFCKVGNPPTNHTSDEKSVPSAVVRGGWSWIGYIADSTSLRAQIRSRPWLKL